MAVCLGLAGDGTFGPQVDAACRPFDFTLYFEDLFFTALPSSVFLLFLPISVRSVWGRRPCVKPSWLLISKIAVLAALFVFQATFLALRSNNPNTKNNVSLLADVLQLQALAGALFLTYLQHCLSIRPSTLLSLIFSFQSLVGIARLRTLWLLPTARPEAAVFSVILAFTLLALGLESKGKESIFDSHVEKPKSPEPFSGFWNLVTFAWLAGTFRRGYGTILSVNHLPELDPRLTSHKLHGKIENSWSKCDHQRKHSLLSACFRAYGSFFLSAVVPRLCLSGFKFAQPFLINTMIAFIGDPNADINSGKGLIGAYALVYLGIATSTSLYWYHTFRFITCLRGGLISLIHMQTVQSRAIDLGEITAITLMGTDVERIIIGFRSIHEVWASLLDIAIAIYLLEQQVFVACIVPVLIILVFVVIIGKVSVFSKEAQRSWIERVEDRLRLTSSMLGDMKAVKMLGLSDLMFNTIQGLRKIEIQTSLAFRKLLIWKIFLSNSPAFLAPVATFALFTIIALVRKDESILAAKAFTSMALIELLVAPVMAFIQAIPAVVECIGCFDRIQEYCSKPNYKESLNAELFDDEENGSGAALVRLRKLHDRPPMIRQLDFSYLHDEDEISTLQGSKEKIISFENQSFGWQKDDSPVLKKLHFSIEANAFTMVLGAVGSGKSTLLESILGETLSKGGQTERYAAFFGYCSQTPWLSNTTIREIIVGPSELDFKWYETVLWACGLAADLGQLPYGDQTSVGSNGVNLSGGQRQRISLARAVYSRSKFVVLDDIFSGIDASTTESISRRLFGDGGIFRRNETTVVLATHTYTLLSYADNIVVLDNGEVVEIGTFAALRTGGKYVPKMLTESSKRMTDTERTSNESCSVLCPSLTDQLGDENLSSSKRQNGDFSVYSYYCKAGGYAAVCIFMIMNLLGAFLREFPTVWLNIWSSANAKDPNGNVGFYLGIYAFLSIAGSISLLGACWMLFANIMSKTAIKIHQDLLKSTVRATFQFFQKTDTGALTNRFSQDLELIDMALPMEAFNYLANACVCLVKAVILAIFAKYLAAVMPFVIALVYLTQKFYLRTSRQIRLLDIEAKAPLYSHFLETVAGASTIRGFGWQDTSDSRCKYLLDISQRPAYLLYCIQQCLALVLDLIISAVAVILVAVVVTWRTSFQPGEVGVALVMLMSFSQILMSVVKFWTMMETSVGAVGRVKNFVADTKSEESLLCPTPLPESWPSAGAIRFSRVFAAHTPTAGPVLKGVSISIKPGQKVVICGRSGSGKTSLLLTLLQMIPIQGGSITIDGLDLSQSKKAEVRSRINVVTQEPFLLPGTLRFNIDPSRSAKDTDIVNALKKLRLWDMVKGNGGLDMEMTTSSWSAGQRQLLCLARAVVRKTKILALDEATSSVDADTEAVMQRVINTEFAGVTVLAVMHRLKFATQYDRVCVLDKGSVVEFDKPATLLSTDSQFLALYKSARN